MLERPGVVIAGAEEDQEELTSSVVGAFDLLHREPGQLQLLRLYMADKENHGHGCVPLLQYTSVVALAVPCWCEVSQGG